MYKSHIRGVLFIELQINLIGGIMKIYNLFFINTDILFTNKSWGGYLGRKF